MNYKKGFKIKPERIDNKGRVYFTDGTNEVNPNQVSCEAYGYKYNKFSKTCNIDNASFNLEKEFQVSSNTLNGIDNKLNARVTNANINGNGNTAKGQNDSIFISGNNNTVANGVNNAAILSGSFAQAFRTGEVIIGGSQDDGLPTTSGGTSTFRTQTSIFHLTGVSSASNPISYLTLSGVDTIEGIKFQPNTIAFFEGRIIGASEGTNERYMSEIKFCVTCNSNNVPNISVFTNTELVNNIGNNAVILVLTGADANANTGNVGLYQDNEVYIVSGEALFGGTKTIAWSVSCKLAEQIHAINTNITTN